MLQWFLKVFVIVFLLLFHTASIAWSYSCEHKANYALEHSDRFDVDADGTLTDIKSGLTWMRCSIGQTWNGNSCIGTSVSIPWQIAIQATQKLNQAGGFASYNDWRLPKLTELASIVDPQCKYPRINLTLFPRTPSADYWSMDKKPGTDNSIYILGFGLTGVSTSPVDELHYLRLVRGRE